MPALEGIKVLEFAGLGGASAPICGQILADFGATVTQIHRISYKNLMVLSNGKRKLAINLKKPKGVEIVKALCLIHDVLLDSFRPGVLENMGLGPVDLLKCNPRIIYARLTGFGQLGPQAQQPGHDINFVAISGILSLLGRKDENFSPPINVLADFAAGSLLYAFGICAALLERTRSGKGQILDSSMVEGCAYIGGWIKQTQKELFGGDGRGDNWLEPRYHFYNSYKTKDNKYMAVGAVEPTFYRNLLNKLGLDKDKVLQFQQFEKNRKLFQKVFLTKTQSEWINIFEGAAACVTPVLNWQAACEYPHNNVRSSFVQQDSNILPNPAPKLSRTPADCAALRPRKTDYEDSLNAMKEINLNADDVRKLYDDGVLMLADRPKL